MYLNRSSARNKQQGIGLPATVFLIVIVALIVLALGDINTKSNIGFGQDFYSVKAFYAAESGAQIALNRVIMGGQVCPTTASTLVSIDFDTVTDNSGLETCNVSVSCLRTSVDTINYYNFISAARCGSGYEQAQRSIEVRAHE